MEMDTRVFADLDALSHAALNELLRIMQEAIDQRGRFAIALAGGRTPARLYSLWSHEQPMPWDRVHLFWGDERYVSQNDLLSNFRMVREALIAHVPIPPANVHPIPTDQPGPEQAAEAYESTLRAFFGAAAPALDLVLLGLGPEGHTASLFPDSPALGETKRLVVAVKAPANPPNRITFTPALLDLARNTFFLVSGADKRAIVAALRQESPAAANQFPAARIRPAGPVVWFLDRAACS